MIRDGSCPILPLHYNVIVKFSPDFERPFCIVVDGAATQCRIVVLQGSHLGTMSQHHFAFGLRCGPDDSDLLDDTSHLETLLGRMACRLGQLIHEKLHTSKGKY